MSKNFRIELAGTPYATDKVKSIKVFGNGHQDLPIKIDHEKRYAVFYVDGEQFIERFYNFEVRKDDIWVITMPKCGTTWMMELVWLLANNLDYETATKEKQEDRCPFFEFSGIFPSITPNSIDVVENCKSPRVIKCHLAMHMLPKALWTVKPKIVYVAREPKDAAISYYHFMTGVGRNQADKEPFLDTVIKNEMFFNPFWKHIAEFWQLRNESYVYFTSYERMKKNLRTIVHQICEFLEKPALSNEEMEKIMQHLSFEQMKNNPTCNHNEEMQTIKNTSGSNDKEFNFIRKGEVGSHKEDLSEKMIKQFEDWTNNELEPYGLTSREILYS